MFFGITSCHAGVPCGQPASAASSALARLVAAAAPRAPFSMAHPSTGGEWGCAGKAARDHVFVEA